jgi:23S rRNA U2552 (ribose-2'-O)-methylase RlmE/FtsJ
MSLAVTKPPWSQIRWFPQAKWFSEQDSSGCLIQGEWTEDRNDEVEKLKESIQPFDKTELWDLAKRITNPYELINTHSSRLSLPRSVCSIYPLSRSYFKMIELLTQLQFFDRQKAVKLRSLHVCEGPGGFIEAFYAMAADKRRQIQVSHAMTLRSTHTMIPGWRRATQFLQKHTTIQLLYGPSRTGNIYETGCQEECRKAVGTGGAHLVTADGGFDFSDDFHAQEKSMLRLIVCSALILLDCVATEGDIILKLFDCNSPVTRDIVYLLASCFKSWTLYKPVTSRPCNSEWYFLGKSAIFQRKSAINVLKQLAEQLGQEPQPQYSRLVVSNPIDEQLKDLQAQRIAKQKDALNQVLAFCHQKDSVSQDAMWQKQRPACIDWCNAFRIPSS